MHNEFTLVKSKRGRRSKQAKLISNHIGAEGDFFDEVKLKRKLNEVINKLPEEHFTVEFVADIRSALKKLKKTAIDVILCYGLGKFSENQASLHQLAGLIFIQRTFESTVQIFDPAFNSAETVFLKNFGFEVIEDNEEGKRSLEEDKLTLVFLPHCPKQLINNFLWVNWNKKLKNCIVISNSFSQILTNNTKRTIADSANYISRSFEFCEEIPVKDSYCHPNVFNDTSIHIFHKLEENSKIFELPAEEPKYTEDTEFVTRAIDSLKV